MSAKRSRTGCLTCRSRKLKCSEDKPTCAQCLKANRECVQSSGVTFRHQQNPSLNGDGDDNLKAFYGYKDSFEKTTTWVEIPPGLTFLHTSNPYEDDLETEQDDSISRETQGLDALSAAVANQQTRDQYSHAPSSGASPRQQGNTPHTTQNLDFILNPSEVVNGPTNDIDPLLNAQEPAEQTTSPGQDIRQEPEHVRTSSYASSRPSLLDSQELNVERALARRCASGGIADPELAFLLRDYAERAGLWMDLFDLGLFFATTVPSQAVNCPLLLYSCVALSAKSLARVDGRKPVLGGQIEAGRQSGMEMWPGRSMTQAKWYQKAREYYDLAVSLLRQALSGAERPSSSSLKSDTIPGSVQNAPGYPLPTTESDELVAATAILCVYEFLDASRSEWSRHLDGAKTLFDIAQDRMVTLASLPASPVAANAEVAKRLSSLVQEPASPARRVLSKNRRSVFWNFARQDMLSAFINNSSTRLDTSDLAMWRSAGLKLTPRGLVCPSNRSHPHFMPENAMSEDTISNCLVWLLSKLVNFIAAGDDLPSMLSSPGVGVRQRELLEYWQGLDDQLTVWYNGLPDTFRAPAVWTPEADNLGLEQKWFPRPMCASTMQSYHFARIQLLHNKPHETTGLPSPTAPHESTGLAARHASYASILQQSRDHAKEIIAIGLGRSDEGTRIHSVQPLWTAGLVLVNGTEGGELQQETDLLRRSVISQLRGIERDMGWASEYRVQSLLSLWNLPPDWGLHTNRDVG